MNVIVNSQILAQELRLVNKIAPTKPTIPILSHVLITAEEESLHFYATDLEIGVRTPCLVVIKEPGTVALPAARLLALVEQFPNAEVTIATDGAGVRVTCGASHTKLQALPTRDFPTPPTVEGQAHTLSAPDLRRLIDQTRYAVDDSNSKYFLQGALLSLGDPFAAMVTTDGKRVALATMPQTGPTTRIILPVKTLDLLSAQPELHSIEMTIGERHVFFVSKGRLIVSRMFEGTFPAYERIIPKSNDLVAHVDRIALAAALRRVGLVAGENCATNLEFAPGTLDISAASAGVGESNERLLITYDGEPLTVCVSWQSLLDVMNVATGKAVTLRLKDALSPILVLDGDHHMAVIVTIRT